MNFQNTGDDNRNFLGQLSESRLRTTVDNLAGNRLEKAKDQEEIAKVFEDAYKDLGYKAKVIYTDPENAPQLIDEKGNPKAGTAYVGAEGEHTIIINVKDPKNSTRSGIIGTISEEGSHIIGKVEGRQLNTGTTEKGLESLGRATNEYFTEKYKKNDIPIETKSDGKDYSNTDFGENVGDAGGACLGGTLLNRCIKSNEQFVDKVNKVDRQEALRVISFIADFTVLGTPKGIIEGITGKDLLTGEEINLLSRVLGLLPIIKRGYKGAKIGLKLLKGTEKAELLLSDGTKIALKADEVSKFSKGIKNTTENTENIIGSVVKNSKKFEEIPNNVLNHAYKDHTINKLIEEYGKRPEISLRKILEKRSFFNLKWTKETIKKASNKVYREAIEKGITRGSYTTTYLGEKVTIYFNETGNIRTIYGHYKYSYEEFIKLVKKAGK